jgi:uncharacterized protein (DUF1800 family)
MDPGAPPCQEGTPVSATTALSLRRKTKKKRPKNAKGRGKNSGKQQGKGKKNKPKPSTPSTPTTPTPTKPKPSTPTTTPISYDPGAYPATGILPEQARHLVNRFSYGITGALAAEVHAAGGHLAWFDRELDRPFDDNVRYVADWWPDPRLEPAAIYKRQTDNVRGSWEVCYDIGRRTMQRRITSPYQVLEVMTEFWENHFHVPLPTDNIGIYRGPYGELIRAGALGRFEDLLKTAVLHPAMLFYLGNHNSTKKHPNENLGRELLELHTVGVGHHTEDDVKASARILTGYRLRAWSTWEAYYSTADHWTGTVTVKGFTDANTAADGRDVAMRYLSYLAHHPDTARRIATKLVRQFVSDDVSTRLVDELAEVFLAHGTDIKPVLRALVRSPEFAASVDAKLRDADEDVAATYRLLGATPTEPVDNNSAANIVYWQVSGLGLSPFGWPRPDGQPVDARSWASPTRALASMAMHWNMAGKWYPTKQIDFKQPLDFLPTAQLPFRDFVDHLSRVLLHRPATSELLQACCLAAEYQPSTVVKATSDLFAWRWPRIAAAVLDSPAFYQH